MFISLITYTATQENEDLLDSQDIFYIYLQTVQFRNMFRITYKIILYVYNVYAWTLFDKTLSVLHN